MKLEQLTVKMNGREIIHPLDLEIKDSEIFVLMGPSGSGKTTLLRAIAGLTPITSGTIHWPEGKQKMMGLAFQEPRLFPHMNVMDNLSFGLRVRGLSKKERYQRVREFLEIFQLEGLDQRYPHELSGGQKQRVALGRVLVLEPDILLLDEPFSSLDTSLRIELTEWLVQLQKEKQFSILWVTHFLDEAFSVADRIGVMMKGSIKQTGNPVDVYRNPCSEEVASFFSLPNRFERKVWVQLFPDNDIPENKEMGWISSDQLELIMDGSLKYSETSSIRMIEGTVLRVKQEKHGQILVIESEFGNWEVFLDPWKDIVIPEKKSAVHVRIPFHKIIWYSRDSEGRAI